MRIRDFFLMGTAIVVGMYWAGYGDKQVELMDRATKADIIRIYCADHPVFYGCKK